MWRFVAAPTSELTPQLHASDNNPLACDNSSSSPPPPQNRLVLLCMLFASFAELSFSELDAHLFVEGNAPPDSNRDVDGWKKVKMCFVSLFCLSNRELAANSLTSFLK